MSLRPPRDPGALVARAIPMPWFTEGVRVVREQAETTAANDTKRTMAISILMRVLHISENTARLIVEIALLFVKLEMKQA